MQNSKSKSNQTKITPHLRRWLFQRLLDVLKSTPASRFNILPSIWSFLFVCLALGCGEITTNVNSDRNVPVGNTAVVLGSSFTDPNGTLSHLSIDTPRQATLNVQTTHSDAIVKAFDDLLYVVNRLGADNIQIIDPSQNFTVTGQFSTGQGTNPQQIFVTFPNKAYITLLQPEDNRSANLTVDDVIIMNPEDGTIVKTIDLTSFTTDDGERLARASSLVAGDNKFFVLIGDLPSGFVAPNQAGKIAVIDPLTDTVVDAAELPGRNPQNMVFSPDTNQLYITNADFADTGSPHGGISIVDAETLTGSMLITDDELGGAPGDIELTGSKGFVVVSYLDLASFIFVSKVMSFNLDPNANRELTDVYISDGFIQDIAIDQNGNLLVGDRDPNVNGIVFVDPATNAVLDTPITTGLPPSSITFVAIE